MSSAPQPSTPSSGPSPGPTDAPHASPARSYQALQGEAQGVQVRVGHWNELAPLASPVRREVFVAEQGIPESEEWDAADATALHAVALSPSGEALGTGRLLSGYRGDAPGVGRIGRMAVRRVVRGTGVGDAILQALIGAARARGDTQLVLSAQCSAEGFYARSGFVPMGQPYDDVGIAHQDMGLALASSA